VGFSGASEVSQSRRRWSRVRSPDRQASALESRAKVVGKAGLQLSRPISLDRTPSNRLRMPCITTKAAFRRRVSRHIQSCCSTGPQRRRVQPACLPRELEVCQAAGQENITNFRVEFHDRSDPPSCPSTRWCPVSTTGSTMRAPKRICCSGPGPVGGYRMSAWVRGSQPHGRDREGVPLHRQDVSSVRG
jgi:hypothetical protein